MATTPTADAQSWWSRDTIAVVTGANKGIGAAMVEVLATKGLTVVLTSRDLAKGQATLESLKSKGLNSVFIHVLDTKSQESASNLASWLKETFGGIDILINNAGVSYYSSTPTYENAKDTVETNFFGVKNVIEALLPLLRPSAAGARIVNVTSKVGTYDLFRSETLKQKFRDETALSSPETIVSLAEKYLDDFQHGRIDGEGWVPLNQMGFTMYTESKVFQNAYSRILAKSLEKSQPEDHKIYVASFCPGVCQTDMLTQALQAVVASGVPLSELKINIKTPAEGADTGVWLSLLPSEEWKPKVGKLFLDRSELPFGSGMDARTAFRVNS